MVASGVTSRGSTSWRRWGLAAAVVALAGTGVLAPVSAGAITTSADLAVTVSHSPTSATTGDEVTFTLS